MNRKVINTITNIKLWIEFSWESINLVVMSSVKRSLLFCVYYSTVKVVRFAWILRVNSHWAACRSILWAKYYLAFCILFSKQKRDRMGSMAPRAAAKPCETCCDYFKGCVRPLVPPSLALPAAARRCSFSKNWP